MTMTHHHPGIAYRPEIDALRAVAVLPVILFHAGIPGFSGGYVGVDVFFVISGFLITSILVRDLDSGTFSLLKFYDRRVRRIFPVLVLVISASLLAGWFLMLPKDFEDTGQSAVAAAAFLSNVLFYIKTGYFAGPAETKALLHTWSLAVEEQFYLLFPIILWLVWRLTRKALFPTLLFLGLASFIGMHAAMNEDTSFAFYMFPTRGWELLLGSIVAIAPARRPAAGVMTATGLLLIASTVALADENTRFPGWAAVPPALGAALVIHFSPAAGLTKALTWKPLILIGLMSYSLYLWHWPILVFMRYWTVRPLDASEIVVAITLTFAVSSLSWRFIEQPIRRLQGISSLRVVTAGIAAVSVPAALGLAVVHYKGVPERMPAAIADILALKDFNPTKVDGCTPLKEFAAASVCHVGEAGLQPAFALWGDSHAGSWRPGIDAAARRAGQAGLLFTANGCPPVIGLELRDTANDCIRFAEFVQERLQIEKISRLFLAARWSAYERPGRIKNGGGSLEAWRSVLMESLRKQSAAFDLIFVHEVPGSEYDVPSARARTILFGRTVDFGVSQDAREKRDRTVRKVVASLVSQGMVRSVDPASKICDEVRCEAVHNGVALYTDHSHLTEDASLSAGVSFDHLLESVMQQSDVNKSGSPKIQPGDR